MNSSSIRTTMLLTILVSTCASAELTGNVGVTSNYLWRGETRTNDRPAVFGGLDYVHGSGFYLGTWTSTIDPHRADNYPPASDDYDPGLVNQDYEWDLYAGFLRQLGVVKLDIGYINYDFPRGDRFNPATHRLEPQSGNEQDFAELYLGVGYEMFSARYWHSDDYRGSDRSLYYLEFNLTIPLRDELLLGLHAGFKKGEPINDGESRVSDYHASLIKGAFRFTVSQMSDNEDAHQSDNPRVSVSWLHHIDL